MIVDTHCHLDFPEFNDDLGAVISRAEEAGIKRIINVASSVSGCARGKELAAQYENIYYSVGIHPHHAEEVKAEELEALKKITVNDKKLAAIGEVGYDFYRNLSPKKAQEELFAFFCALKNDTGLPLIIHSREALKDTLIALRSNIKPPINGVMHCFSGGEEDLKKVLDMGFYVSFTCNVTFKNAAMLREIVKFVPLDRLLLETDAPFLAPQPHRGKRNEPSYIIYLIQAISEILDISKTQIEDITTKNAKDLFGLGL